jgi:hypothetical protein
MKLIKGIKGFCRDTRGTVVVMGALSLVPLLGMAGVALDYGRGLRAQSTLQSATDAAALAAVSVRVPTTAMREQTAKNIFAANSTGVTATPTLDVTRKRATVTASGQLETSLLKVLRIDKFDISARSTAEKIFAGPPPCILALNPTVTEAIKISGTAEYVALGCAMQSNSSSGDALYIGSNTKVTASAFCAVGRTNVPSSLAPLAMDYCEPLSDPFASLAAPPGASGDCGPGPSKIQPSETVQLDPDLGIFCDGLDIKGTALLKNGTYVIKGALNVNSTATVKGKDVTFYLTGPNAGFTFNGSGASDVSAPTTGPYAGILFFVDRNANPGATSSFNGNSAAQISGSIYAPKQTVSIGGTAGVEQDGTFLPIIADQVVITGSVHASAAMAEGDLSLPLPNTESGVRLVQ